MGPAAIAMNELLDIRARALGHAQPEPVIVDAARRQAENVLRANVGRSTMHDAERSALLDFQWINARVNSGGSIVFRSFLVPGHAAELLQ